MPSLAEIQANFIATINEGPAALDARIFSGDAGRVLLGLRAHANTISHARLTALEDIFPRCMEALGAQKFNALARKFCESAPARACDNNAIGGEFLRFIHAQDVPADICDLAEIEWLWLAAYNAAEAEPLLLADLAGIDEAQLLNMPAAAHPAAHMHALSAPISPALPELANLQEAAEPAADIQPAAILITRPQAQVALFTLNVSQQALFAMLAENTENNLLLGNLLEFSAEQEGGEDALAPVITLINAGALQKHPSI